MRKTYQHLFFDLDGTVTPSRSKILPKMARLLSTLKKTIVIVSGSQNEQMRTQIGDLKCFQLGQNGNQAIGIDGANLWSNSLSEKEKTEIHAHIDLIKNAFSHSVPDENDLVEDRGSQISFSIFGHNAPTDEKKAFDGNFKKRKDFLQRFPFHSKTIEVQLGGSTCFDYFKRGHNKGRNVLRLIELMQWEKDECVYFGDALFEGGNDSSVCGIIDTIEVIDENDTYLKLKKFC